MHSKSVSAALTGSVMVILALNACGGAANAPASGLSSSAPAAASAPAVSSGSSVAKPSAAAPGASAATGAASAGASSGPPSTTASTANQPQITLKVGTQHVTTDAPLYIDMAKGFFKAQNLNVQFTNINGAEAISAVGTGQLDVSVGAIYSGLFNAISRGVDIRLVATKGSGALKDDPSKEPAAALVIRKQLIDSGAVKTVKDLKGKSIAIASLGATQEETLDYILNTAGLSVADVTLKTMPFPDTVPALANGSIDGAMELQPWISQGLDKGIFTVFATTTATAPGLQTNALTYGPTLTKNNREAGNRFMVAYTQGIRWYDDAVGPKHANWDDFVSIMVQNTSLKDKALYDKIGWTPMNPDCSLNVPSIQKNVDWYMAHGYVKDKPNLATAVDDSFCQNAVKVLGPYKA